MSVNLLKIWWVMSQENLFSAVCGQVTHKPACSTTETSWNPATLANTTSKQWTTKVHGLIRLHGCAGWSVPLLFTYGTRQASHVVALMMSQSSSATRSWKLAIGERGCSARPGYLCERLWDMPSFEYWLSLRCRCLFYALKTSEFYMYDTVIKIFAWLFHEMVETLGESEVQRLFFQRFSTDLQTVIYKQQITASINLFLKYTWISRSLARYMSRRNTKPTKLPVRPAKTQSDQSLCHPHEESLGPWLPNECTAKTLIRPGGCQGWSEWANVWSEGWLGAQVILSVLLCCSSYDSPVWKPCDFIFTVKILKIRTPEKIAVIMSPTSKKLRGGILVWACACMCACMHPSVTYTFCIQSRTIRDRIMKFNM